MFNQTKLLYIEDEIDLGSVTKQYLELMNIQVDWLTSPSIALEKYKLNHMDYSMVLIDIQLPEMDGFTLAEKLLEIDNKVYLLFLTARKDKLDRIRGLQLGAINYITKPFDVDELVYQVQNILKHQKPQLENKSYRNTLTIGDLVINKSNFTLQFSLSNQTINLTEKELLLLEYFYEHTGEIVRRKDILENIWGEDDYFLGRSMDVFISRLRKALKESKNVKIENVYGVGFILTII